MKRLCYLGILKEGFSAYSSQVMLISRKMTQDKRVVTDFRHLNMRIAKNNLAYQLLKDTFTLLGSSKCEVMSVLDLKDAFHSLRLTENSKKYCGILSYFGRALYLYQGMPMGLNISPAVWQSYINAILSCLSSVKLLWMTCCYSHQGIPFCQARRLGKDFVQEWVENLSKEMPIVQDRVTVYG